MTGEREPTASVAGWYPDPIGRYELRFHNGRAWTADVSTAGQRFVDPAGTAPAAPPSSAGGTGAATAALVLGIVAVTTAWLPFLVVIGAITGLLAIVLGLSARRRVDGHGRAVAGVALGATALVACLIGVALTVVVVDVYRAYVDPADHEVTITGCDLAGSRVTVTGEIVNLDDEPADFGVVVEIADGSTRRSATRVRTTVDDVAPGATAEFDVQRQVGIDEVECTVVDVTGPLPFGVAID